ncbi:hypothetical protein [Faecalibacterium sp. An122]|uniref:hypothetical protein n=1 Tax=Faecalibacterium sp. An122 TaxID=1965551 RepID=UPI00117ACD9E|nr:hypothetical protein [Faecalibacterium sp. An122]
MELPRGPLTQHFLNTMEYIAILYFLDADELHQALGSLYPWEWICVAMFAFGLVFFVRILTDWQLLRGRPGLWRHFYGDVDDSFLEQYRRMLTYEHGETSVTTGFSSGAMLLMLAAIVVSFVWFAFLA